MKNKERPELVLGDCKSNMGSGMLPQQKSSAKSRQTLMEVERVCGALP